MLELQITQRAEQDIDAILDYSVREFGPSVADRYRRAIFSAIGRVRGRPSLGRPVRLRPGMLKLAVREHAL